MTQILPKTLEARSIISQEKVSQPIQLSDKRGLVVVFLSAKCPCSNSHIEILKNLAVKYKEFKFIGIHSNTDEDLKTSKDYFTQAQLPFEVLEDKNAILADQFKAYKTPHAFLINNKSELVYQGGVTDSALAEHSKKNYLTLALEDLTENRSVKITEGRTLGCVILRTEKTTVDQHVF